ncbi:hypothetical protein HK101_011031 [Irineochytrium annulatum]|nr:hypothetical protein HK101_011031 [Irineochytrium annulatum]
MVINEQLLGINDSDGGGQYDDAPHGSEPSSGADASLQGFSHYVEIVGGGIYCMRTCDTSGQDASSPCNMHRDTEGCSNVIGGSYGAGFSFEDKSSGGGSSHAVGGVTTTTAATAATTATTSKTTSAASKTTLPGTRLQSTTTTATAPPSDTISTVSTGTSSATSATATVTTISSSAAGTSLGHLMEASFKALVFVAMMAMMVLA